SVISLWRRKSPRRSSVPSASLIKINRHCPSPADISLIFLSKNLAKDFNGTIANFYSRFLPIFTMIKYNAKKYTWKRKHEIWGNCPRKTDKASKPLQCGNIHKRERRRRRRKVCWSFRGSASAGCRGTNGM